MVKIHWNTKNFTLKYVEKNDLLIKSITRLIKIYYKTTLSVNQNDTAINKKKKKFMIMLAVYVLIWNSY